MLPLLTAYQKEPNSLDKSVLTSGLQTCETMNFYCLSHPVFGILIWQPQQTNIIQTLVSFVQFPQRDRGGRGNCKYKYSFSQSSLWQRKQHSVSSPTLRAYMVMDSLGQRTEVATAHNSKLNLPSRFLPQNDIQSPYILVSCRSSWDILVQLIGLLL